MAWPSTIVPAPPRVTLPPEEPGWTEAPPQPSLLWSGPAWTVFLAGFLTPFTLPLVGELPAGEILFGAAAVWAMLCAIMNHATPGALFAQPLFRRFMVAQLVAFAAYVMSDLYRHSAPHDMARGWSRMIMLAVDIVAVVYLFSRSPASLPVFIVGEALGEAVSALTIGALFGDLWKFGFGAPISFLIFMGAPVLGPLVTFVAGAGIGVAHFLLDYRSFGGLCLVAGTLGLLQTVRPAFRLWLAPLGLMAMAGACFLIYERTQTTTHRTTRSDVERAAMVEAAMQAVEESPVIGHGSWFSNSDVYDNFMRIRFARAREAHVGGFADPNKKPDTMALHSQLLVSLAEGGLFGGAFFLVFGAAVFWALCDIVFAQPWHRLAPIYTLLLLNALWNLFFSPFSGAHRVHIAMACGLVLMVQADAAQRRASEVAEA